MKLNPPASSSDLDVARAIGRRLHQRARGGEADTAAPADTILGAELRPARSESPIAGPAAVPLRTLPSQPEVPDLPEPSEAAPEMPQLESEPGEALTGSSASFEPMPEAPELDESPELESMPPGGYTTEAEPFEAPEEPAPEGPPLELEPPGGYVAEVEPPETGLPGLETDEPALDAADSDLGAAAREADEALSELTDSADEPSLPGLEAPAVGGVSPEDLVSEDTAPEWSEDLPIDAEIASPGEEPPTAAEDLVEVPTPSWDDVADSCLALAPAHGAMLVDPSGQVLTARGEWPEPGPEAIAGRLVSMMEKKLRDAPTRSVSAPLAGQHLTAWRVPADEGYLTIVFMAAAPLRADVRPAIDTAIQASGA